MKVPAAFLDRDGTISVEKHYMFRFSDWEWIPGSIDAIKRLNKQGLKVIVVSNQAGIARGYYTEGEVDDLHRQVLDQLRTDSARIDAFYICPHHPDYGSHRACSCRKPAPGIILHAAHDLGIDLSRSYLVGDKASDVRAAIAAGVFPVMVATGYGAAQRASVPESVPFVSDLFAAVEYIDGRQRPMLLVP